MAEPLDTERMWTKLQSEATAQTWNGLNWAECSALLQEVERLKGGVPVERVLERVRTVLAAHNGETLDTYTAGIIEVEIIQSLAKPKEGQDRGK